MSRTLKYRIGASMAAFAAMLVLAAPVYAAATLTCSVGSTEPALVTCSGTGWDTQIANPSILHNSLDECGGAGCMPCVMDGNGDFTDCEVCNGDPPEQVLEAGTWYLYGTQNNCQTSVADATNPHIVTAYEAALLTFVDLYSRDELVDQVVAVISQVGPYVLALFGIMLVVGVGMALLRRGRRQFVAAIGGTKKKD